MTNGPVTPLLGDVDADGLTVGDADGDGLSEGDGEPVGNGGGVDDTVGDGSADRIGQGVRLGEAVGGTDAQPIRTTETAARIASRLARDSAARRGRPMTLSAIGSARPRRSTS